MVYLFIISEALHTLQAKLLLMITRGFYQMRVRRHECGFFGCTNNDSRG